jgi:hypothetical protein
MDYGPVLSVSSLMTANPLSLPPHPKSTIRGGSRRLKVPHDDPHPKTMSTQLHGAGRYRFDKHSLVEPCLF